MKGFNLIVVAIVVICAACGGPPSDYKDRGVGSDDNTGGSNAKGDTADAGDKNADAGTGGAGGSSAGGNSSGTGGSPSNNTGGSNANTGTGGGSGGSSAGGNSSGTGGSSGSNTGGSDAGTGGSSGSSGAGGGSSGAGGVDAGPQPTYTYQGLKLPDVKANDIGQPSLEQWRYAGSCVGIQRSLDELIAISLNEANSRAGGSLDSNYFIEASWARVELMRWYSKCPAETGNLTDDEVVASFCPASVSYGKCFEGIDPRDFSTNTVPPAALALADLACYSNTGTARVTAMKAAENFGSLSQALESPTTDEAAALSATVYTKGLASKSIVQGYALVTAGTYVLSCVARQVE